VPRLTVCLPQGADVWAKDLNLRLAGQVQASAWRDGDAPAELAVVWKPPPAFFAQQAQLQAVFAAGAGVDGLLALKPPAHVPLFRLEDAGMGVQMAEYALHAILRWHRQFDVYAAQAQDARWQPQPPLRKADWTVGLLGFGVLAQPLARALQGLNFPVQAWARGARQGGGLPVFTGEDGLRAVLAGSRVVVALLPLTPDTQGLLNAERLACMAPGSYLVNVARGGLVDEAALLDALDRGHLAGAALDVCVTEPAGPEHPFWHHPHVQLTPHIAGATLRDEALDQIADKLRAWLRGEPISGRVSLEAGY
jgi:glyoxylate/hydroxypyruvate reductase A